MISSDNYMEGKNMFHGFAQAVYAAGSVGIIDPTTTSVPNIINLIIGWILPTVGGIAVLFIVWGGLQYITSSGNKDRADSAKKTITYAILGLIFIVLADLIVTVATNSAGEIAGIAREEQEAIMEEATASEAVAQVDIVKATTPSADSPAEDPLATLPEDQVDDALANEEVPLPGEDSGEDVSDAELKNLKKENIAMGLPGVWYALLGEKAYARSKSQIAYEAANVAYSQKGTKEKPQNKGTAISKYFKATNPSKDCKSPNPWCAAFLSWSFKKAGTTDFATCSSVKMINEFKHNGHTQYKYGTSSSLMPTYGDVLWRPRKGGHGHVGIVWNIDRNNKTIYTVEGNSDNKVKVKKYKNYGRGAWTKLGRL